MKRLLGLVALLSCTDNYMTASSQFAPTIFAVAMQDGSSIPGKQAAELWISAKPQPVKYRLTLGSEDPIARRSWGIDATLSEAQVLSGSFTVDVVAPQAAGPGTLPAPGQAVVELSTWESDASHPLGMREGLAIDSAHAGKVTIKIEGNKISGEAILDPGHLSARFSGKFSRFCYAVASSMPEASRPEDFLSLGPDRIVSDAKWESDFCRKYKPAP